MSCFLTWLQIRRQCDAEHRFSFNINQQPVFDPSGLMRTSLCFSGAFLRGDKDGDESGWDRRGEVLKKEAGWFTSSLPHVDIQTSLTSVKFPVHPRRRNQPTFTSSSSSHSISPPSPLIYICTHLEPWVHLSNWENNTANIREVKKDS